MGLRKIKGVKKTEFYDRFGKTIEEVYESVIKRFLNEKLLVEKDGFIALTDRGLDVSNYVMSEFILC